MMIKFSIESGLTIFKDIGFKISLIGSKGESCYITRVVKTKGVSLNALKSKKDSPSSNPHTIPLRRGRGIQNQREETAI